MVRVSMMPCCLHLLHVRNTHTHSLIHTHTHCTGASHPQQGVTLINSLTGKAGEEVKAGRVWKDGLWLERLDAPVCQSCCWQTHRLVGIDFTSFLLGLSHCFSCWVMKSVSCAKLTVRPQPRPQPQIQPQPQPSTWTRHKTPKTKTVSLNAVWDLL